MIKNENGITMAALVVTIIVMMILLTVGVRTIYLGVEDYGEARVESELQVVRQFVIEQYEKAKALNLLNEEFGNSQNQLFLKDLLPQSKEYTTYDNHTISNAGIPEQKNRQIDAYYILEPSKMQGLGFNNVGDTYIVNYSTAEVYNISRLDKDGKIQYYLPAIDIENVVTKSENKTDFNDWKDDVENEEQPQENGD